LNILTYRWGKDFLRLRKDERRRRSHRYVD
jgi:hypothetical protein